MSAFFSNSLAVALPSLLSSCFISAALSTSQVGRLVDWLVGQTFNSENREFLARSHAKKARVRKTRAARLPQLRPGPGPRVTTQSNPTGESFGFLNG